MQFKGRPAGDRLSQLSISAAEPRDKATGHIPREILRRRCRRGT